MPKGVLFAVICGCLAVPGASYAGCDYDLIGTWQSTHVSMSLDEDKLADDSQAWTFKRSGKVEHKGPITQEFDYECEGDQVTLHAQIPNTLTIVRHSGDRMVWESNDFGGFIYVERR